MEMVNSNDLVEHLTLHPPSSPETAPAAFRFNRFRQIEIPWEDVIKDPPGLLGSEDKIGPSSSIRDFFLDSWIKHKNIWHGQDTSSLESEFRDFKEFLWSYGELIVDDRHEFDAPREIFYLIHLPSKRPYVLLDKHGNITKLDSEQDNVNFVELWAASDAVAAEMAYLTEEQKAAEISSAEYVSREPLIWRQEYARLDALEKLGENLANYAKSIVESDEDVRSRWWTEPNSVESDIRKFTDLSTKREQAKALKQKLASIVSANGYFLALQSQTFPNPKPGEAEITVNAGDVYRRSKRVVRWSTSHTVTRTYTRRGRSGRRKTYTQRYVETKHRSAVVDHFELITFEDDPVEKHQASLVNQGKEVFYFNVTEGGYLTADGQQLSEVVLRCELDAEFRSRCVVVVPDFSPFVSGQDSYLGATFFFNPLPASQPTRFPVLALRESLAYSIQWVRAELGQLVKTINLAPGEERAVEYATSFEDEVTNTSSFRRADEFSTEHTLDLATHIENEAGREFSKTKQRTSSVSAGGSYGDFSASGSVSNSSTESVKQFSRHLTKIARRAVQKLNRRMTQEITTTRSQTIKSSTSSSRTLEIRNINQGRTLNLLFYQINNIFRGGVYLDDLELTVVSGRELIAGSDIYDVKTFPLRELDELVEQFAPESLPVETNLDERRIDSVKAYWNSFLDALLEVLKREYLLLPEQDGGQDGSSVCLVDFETPISFQLAKETGGAGSGELAMKHGDIEDWFSGDIKEKYDEIKDFLSSLVFRPEALEPIEMMVASGGLYVDSLLGSKPATEPYSENMRSIEEAMGEAEVRLLDAKTNIILRGRGQLKILSIEVTDAAGEQEVTALVSCDQPLDAEGTLILLDRELVNVLDVTPAAGGRSNQCKVRFLLPRSQQGLSRQDLENQLVLIDRSSDTPLFYYSMHSEA